VIIRRADRDIIQEMFATEATTQWGCFHHASPAEDRGNESNPLSERIEANFPGPTRSENGSKPIFPDLLAVRTDRSQFSRTNPLSIRIEAKSQIPNLQSRYLLQCPISRLGGLNL
jgi:hypothetical protein